MAWHIQFYKGDSSEAHKAGREHLQVGESIRLEWTSYGTVQECPQDKMLEAILMFQRREQVDDWKQAADYYEANDVLELP